MDTRNDRANRKYNNLFRLENELYHDIAVKMGLSDSAFGILYWLDDLGDGCLQRDVCVASGLTKQTVNSSVHKLERTGFVELRVEQGRRHGTVPFIVHYPPNGEKNERKNIYEKNIRKKPPIVHHRNHASGLVPDGVRQPERRRHKDA